ncbi:hypothetical protein FACS1894156_8570 [Bacteroidia bacterium]|nr:hypothetical protein FACS1894156_8570 [Bacteroidia bacterium]
MSLERIAILDLLPQRPPFVMIDQLTHFDEVLTCTQLTVAADNIFVENGCLSEAGVIENIAQTCAARMGYINKYLQSDTVKLGFIGAIKNLIINNLPKVGEVLNTSIEVVNEVFALTLVNAKVEVGGQLAAACEMKISLTEIEAREDKR